MRLGHYFFLCALSLGLIALTIWTGLDIAPAPTHAKPVSESIQLPGITQDPAQVDQAADIMDFDEIIYVKRKPYSSDHYYTDINNGTSPDRFLPENGIYIFNLKTRQERPVVTAAAMPGGKGFIGKISLSFDAKKVIFDFRENPNAGFRVWEVGLDGTGLKQLTFPPADEAEKAARWRRGWHTDDIHPCYLQDGGILFSSTRCEHTVLCGGSSHLVVPVLHRMNPDGSAVKQISQSLVSEFCPVILDDGRIMYHRWEYVDKGARVCKTIMAMNPDGTHSEEIYGLADDTTTVYMYPQPLPGNENRLVCVGTCHFPQGGCLGAIFLVDFNKSIRMRGPDPDEAGYVKWDERYAVNNITPHTFVERRTEPGWHFLTQAGKYVHDRNGQRGYLYTHPFPVNDDTFLVSVKTRPKDHYKNVANAYALYLIDTQGRHLFVHKDEKLSLWHPTPVVPRRRPPNVSSVRNAEYADRNQAVCIVSDITRGMEGVAPGDVKWIRINEALPRYWSTGRRWNPSLSSSSWKAALWPRVQWGIVPVEKDGSAHFVVPADRNIFFQALDENFREIQRERTYVNYHPGEVRSCTGCHGQSNKGASTNANIKPMAMKRPPSLPQPQPCDKKESGGTGLAGQVIHYPADIQPIFDAKCISCHGKKKQDGGLNLAGDVTTFYSTSYESLARKQLAGPIIPEFTSFHQGDRGNYNGSSLSPKQIGSYKSGLMAILNDADHPKNAKTNHADMLTPNELMILNRWVDSNYQFYGCYYGRQHPQWQKPDPRKPDYNPKDFRRKATFEEAVSKNAPAWHR